MPAGWGSPPKCAEAEALMLKDLDLLKQAGVSADETSLWENLGRR